MRKETVKIICDRCNKEITSWFDKGFRLHKRKIIMTRGPYSNQEEVDLCEDCYKSLRYWYFMKRDNKDLEHERFYNFLLNTLQPNEMEKYRSMFLSSGEIVNSDLKGDDKPLN